MLKFREIKWGTADGRKIPIKELEVGHLVNILNWVYDRPDSYPPRVYPSLVQEANYRKLIEFAAGRPWPNHNGTSWELMSPTTGEGFVQPPPKEYLDKVAELGIDVGFKNGE